ncbi:uncharacterized protein LOC124662839 [Lolium rigidum]|uniref:uncharacterized protein LOC124662839 n=1 Tax=Lolium rigidum TaxID=89674 RepID=UPI001F5E1EF0|nr:uncharacterized protein LOC124662839 [Lolium rigidum]
MASAALRSAARKVCGRAFERPQAYFTTAASAALKEEQRRLLPRIRHGETSLRRFSSSESQSALNNNKQIAKPAAPIADDIIPPDSPFWKMSVVFPISIWSPRHPYHGHLVLLWAAGTLALCSGVVYAESKYLRRDRGILNIKHGSCRCTCCVH